MLITPALAVPRWLTAWADYVEDKDGAEKPGNDLCLSVYCLFNALICFFVALVNLLLTILSVLGPLSTKDLRDENGFVLPGLVAKRDYR